MKSQHNKIKELGITLGENNAIDEQNNMGNNARDVADDDERGGNNGQNT